MSATSHSETSIFTAYSFMQSRDSSGTSDQIFGTTRGQIVSQQWVKLSDVIEAANQSFICRRLRGCEELVSTSPALKLCN